MLNWLLLYVFIMNLITYYLFAQDKSRARKKEWRTSEKKLLMFSFLGGGIGAWRGMKDYFHKINKAKFRILIPIFIVLQLGTAGMAGVYGPAGNYAVSALLVFLHVMIFFLLSKRK
ncbi:DUF1294 domain-containing protein [Ammoniphilus sp. 3BR4]|uniref:DUF1294 domain-containing protein n=1 Tax=Ammoniphilus sp. 3BR4 TaxID=3158265 RepID=UPI003467735B